MKFGIVTDTHLTSPEREPSRFHNFYDFKQARTHFELALERHLQAGVDALIMAGDLANSGDEPYQCLGLELCAATGLRTFIMPGNHDCEEGIAALADRIAQTGTDLIGIPGPTGSMSGDLRIAGLPTTHFDTDDRWEIAPPEVNAWGDEPVLLVSHVPVFSLAGIAAAAGLKYAGDPGNLEEVAAALSSRSEPVIVVNGHLHLQHTIVRGSTLQISCAAMVEPPHAMTTLEVVIDGIDLTVTIRHDSVALSHAAHLPVLSPACQRYRFQDGSWLEEASAIDGTQPG